MFSSFTQPSFPKAALGIESDEISAVALQSSGKGAFAIKSAASVELPAGMLTPSFTELNIVDEPAFAASLVEVVQLAGLMQQKRWSIALPSNSARAAIIALDSEPANKAEADEVFDWKAEQIFGAPAAELRIAKEKISPDKNGRSRFFATAVKLTVLDQYETHFESLGWRAGLILPRSVGEANWLLDADPHQDSLLISSNPVGFTALLLRGAEPAVVRSVICTPEEVDDEVYRLVMFYNDRFAGDQSVLDRLLVLGSEISSERVQQIASEALGRDIRVLTSDEIGLSIPDDRLQLSDLAAPAGLATLGF